MPISTEALFGTAKKAMILNHTIFNTPLLEAFLHWTSRFILSLTGWRTEGQLPSIPKFVLVGAPHTSNWDLPFTLMTAFALKARIHWMGKEALFSRPFKGLFQWLLNISIVQTE
jgi:1-acyl-sn-glycerol-3-phosphate acyltransferase